MNDSGESRQSVVSAGIKTIGLIVLFIALLFVPAGGFDWIEGWLFFLAFLISVGALVIWGYRKRPDLMRERSAPGENVKRWDQVIMGIYSLMLVVLLVTAALDSGRFSWSSPSLLTYIFGWTGLFLSLGLVWWTFKVNPYLSEQVRIQDDRGHQVVSDGPYQYVRHPMYVGIIVVVFCVPLVLGSYWALLPAGMIAGLFIIRTALEDRTLFEELAGYPEYSERVRYRLLPFVW